MSKNEPTFLHEYGVSSLILAAYRGDRQKVESLLISGEEINTADIDGITPLMAAAMGGHIEIVRMLLKAGADPKIKNKWGQRAREVALWHKNSEIVQALDE